MRTETVNLTAADGHKLQAYVAHPEGKPKAGLVILQEIFGITAHIRSVAESFAAEGYLAIAPAMFDRVGKGIELEYSNFAEARATLEKLDRDLWPIDIRAAADYVRSAGKVGAVGYCWGGALTDLAACNGIIDAGVSYYGRMTIEWLDKQPTCPMYYHYGETDPLITLQTIEDISRKREGKVRVWGGAGHGFNCTDRPDYHKGSAEAARAVTLDFFAEHLS